MGPLKGNTMAMLSVHAPVEVRVPRFAAVAAELFARLLDATGRGVAASRQAAERQREARELRRFARLQAGHDPRFATDLMVAADRHESRD